MKVPEDFLSETGIPEEYVSIGKRQLTPKNHAIS